MQQTEESLLLPFYFRKHQALNKMIITNIQGAYCFLDDYESLQSLIDLELTHLKANLVEELYAKNFICEANEISIRSNLLASHVATSVSSSLFGSLLVLIIPTLRCDHDCSYCQVSRASINAKEYDANINQIPKIINYLNKLNVPNIKIEFQGGEPLLYKEYIQALYNQAVQQLEDKNLSFVICTAIGNNLDNEFIHWCKDRDIVFSISLDGPAEIHNANRPSKYFDGYQCTIDGINRLQNILGHDRVSGLVTVTAKSMQNPEKIIDSYFEAGFESIFIRPLSPLGFAYNNEGISYSEEEFLQFYKQCLNHILDLNQQKLFVEETASVFFKKILSTADTKYLDLQSPSGYLLGCLVFNYDGNIFGSDETRMLWEMTKNEELISASIHDEPSQVVKQSSIALLSDTFIQCLPGCDECAYQPYCGADPLYHLATQGDIIGNKSLSGFCKLQRGLFDFFFENIAKKDFREVHEWIR